MLLMFVSASAVQCVLITLLSLHPALKLRSCETHAAKCSLQCCKILGVNAALIVIATSHSAAGTQNWKKSTRSQNNSLALC